MPLFWHTYCEDSVFYKKAANAYAISYPVRCSNVIELATGVMGHLVRPIYVLVLI